MNHNFEFDPDTGERARPSADDPSSDTGGLISCPDCGKDVSKLAPACIHCGRPLQTQREKPESLTGHAHVTRTGAKWEGLGFVLIIVGMLVGMAANPPLSTIGGSTAFVGFVMFIVGRFK